MAQKEWQRPQTNRNVAPRRQLPDVDDIIAHKERQRPQTNRNVVPRRRLPDVYDAGDQDTEVKGETSHTSRTVNKSSTQNARKVNEPHSQEMNGNEALEHQSETEKILPIHSTAHCLFIDAFVDLHQVEQEFRVDVKFNKATHSIAICGSAPDTKLAYKHIKSITKSFVSQPVEYLKVQVIQYFNSDEGEAFLREEAANNETVVEKNTTFTWKCGKINVTGILVEDRFYFSSSINKKLALNHSDLDGTKTDMKFKLVKDDSIKGGCFSRKSIHCVEILLYDSIDDHMDVFATAMRKVADSRVDNVAFLLSSVAGLALKDIINYSAQFFIEWLLKASFDNVVQVVLCVTNRKEFQEACAVLSETLDKWFECRRFSKHHYTQVSSALVKQAGKKLKRECRKNYKNCIGHGEVAVTDGYKLNCKKVFHISLLPYDTTAENDCFEYVDTIVGQCLRKANEFGFKSVAFPAIGTGKLGYPEDILISLLFASVEKFKTETDETSLEDVQFVIFPREENLFYLFEKLGGKFIRGKAETTKFEKETSMKITITGHKENVENTKSDIERFLVDPNEIITERLYGVNDIQYRAMRELCGDLLTTIKERGFEIQLYRKRNILEFKGKRKSIESIQDLLGLLKNLPQRIFTLPPGLDQELIKDVLTDSRLRNNGVYVALDSDVAGVYVFATTEARCDEALHTNETS